MRVVKSVDLMDERFCLSPLVSFMRPLAPSSEKPEAQLSVLDVVEGRRLCLWPVVRRLLFLLSESSSLWMAASLFRLSLVGLFGKTYNSQPTRNLSPQMQLRA